MTEDTEALRIEAIRKMSAGLNLPPELLPPPDGRTRTQVAEAEAGAFVELTLHSLCDQLTERFLHPALREADVPDIERYSIRLASDD